METSKMPKASSDEAFSFEESPSLDDIIFEGRNKAYGAYRLRQLYNRHLAISTAIAVSLFALFLSVPLIARLIKKEEAFIVIPPPPDDGRVIHILPPPEMEKPNPEPPAAPEPPASPPSSLPTVKHFPPKVEKDQNVLVQEFPSIEQLDNKNIGTEDKDGDPAGIPVPDVLGSPAGIGGTGETSTSTVYEWAEEMPKFSGGAEAMLRYLSRNIRYPSQAQRAGIEGLVVVSFTVATTGEISDIQVLKNLGGGTDEEAIRVVKGMPKWKPGRQNGRAVPVKFTLPIRFSIK